MKVVRFVGSAIMLLAQLAALAAICYAAVDIRLHAVKNYGRVIHEFDPWFNYRATEYLSMNGWKVPTATKLRPPPSGPLSCAGGCSIHARQSGKTGSGMSWCTYMLSDDGSYTYTSRLLISSSERAPSSIRSVDWIVKSSTSESSSSCEKGKRTRVSLPRVGHRAPGSRARLVLERQVRVVLVALVEGEVLPHKGQRFVVAVVAVVILRLHGAALAGRAALAATLQKPLGSRARSGGTPLLSARSATNLVKFDKSCGCETWASGCKTLENFRP